MSERQYTFYLNCKTKYAAFVGDDDFLIPEVCFCKKFLSKNKDYRIAYGNSIR